MFERFTEESRRVVVLAQEEARSLDHEQIGTEHLLLGMIHEDGAEVCGVLGDLGVDVDALRHAVLAVAGRGAHASPVDLHFSRHAKKGLELALREALQAGDRDIRPTHILLGLLREGEGTAAVVAKRQGIDLATVRVVATRTTAAPPEQRRRPRRWRPTRAEAPAMSAPLLLEQFDDTAWEALLLARRSARRRAGSEVDTCDLLIGVSSVDGAAAEALADAGHAAADLVAVVPAHEAATAITDRPPPPALGLAAPVRQVLARSADDVRRTGADAVGTGHVLRALLADADGPLDRALDELGVARADLLDDITRRLE